MTLATLGATFLTVVAGVFVSIIAAIAFDPVRVFFGRHPRLCVGLLVVLALVAAVSADMLTSANEAELTSSIRTTGGEDSSSALVPVIEEGESFADPLATAVYRYDPASSGLPRQELPSVTAVCADLQDRPVGDRFLGVYSCLLDSETPQPVRIFGDPCFAVSTSTVRCASGAGPLLEVPVSEASRPLSKYVPSDDPVPPEHPWLISLENGEICYRVPIRSREYAADVAAFGSRWVCGAALSTAKFDSAAPAEEQLDLPIGEPNFVVKNGVDAATVFGLDVSGDRWTVNRSEGVTSQRDPEAPYVAVGAAWFE